jgi:hypothetical protein
VYGALINVWGIGISLAVAIGDRFSGDLISSIRPSGKVLVAAALAAEWQPARIDRTDTTQDAQLGLAHPNNHNSQRDRFCPAGQNGNNFVGALG